MGVQSEVTSVYGEHVGLGGRVTLVIIALFALGAPVVCFVGFFLVHGLVTGNSGTLANNLGHTGSALVGVILFAMAREFWPQGLRALRASVKTATHPIHRYAETGDTKQIETLVTAGADKNARDTYGNTALHIAAFRGDLLSVSALVDAGADVHARDRLGETALHKVAVGNHASVVAALLTAGADIEAKDVEGGTPLHQAASTGSGDVITALLSAGANKDEHSNEPSLAPIHLAAVAGQAKAVAALLAAGADKQIRTSQGKTPRDIAAEKGHTAVILALDADGTQKVRR